MAQLLWRYCFRFPHRPEGVNRIFLGQTVKKWRKSPTAFSTRFPRFRLEPGFLLLFFNCVCIRNNWPDKFPKTGLDKTAQIGYDEENRVFMREKTMPQLELYENKVLLDEELPIHIAENVRNTPGTIYSVHWHEHLELHYVVEGEALMQVNQTGHRVRPGDLLVVNSNALHSGDALSGPYLAFVMIFEVADLSPELAKNNYLFQPLICQDETVKALFTRIFQEKQAGGCAYKQLCRALALELLVHLCRNYVTDFLPERPGIRHRKNQERLNTVLLFIERNYAEPITNAQLADLICLSEDRFCHLFREGIGSAPLQYINEMRLKKAMALLEHGENTVTEVAEAVGFRDYNHFGRLFRKRFGCTPREVKSGKVNTVE